MPSPRFSTAGNHFGSCASSRALDVGVVLAVDVRRERLEAREPNEGENLAQSVKLDDRGDAVADCEPRRQSVLGQPARVEVGIDRHVVAKALGRAEQRVELDLLDRSLGRPARSDLLDRGEHLVVGERRELRGDLRASSCRKLSSLLGLDDLEVVPELLHGRLDRGLLVRQRSTLTTCGK